MPGLGGRELMERIRELGWKMPLLPMSGYVLAEDQQAEAGYLQKPFTTTDLLRKVKAAIAAGTVVD
jgi:CheY-like chemotaxis protein